MGSSAHRFWVPSKAQAAEFKSCLPAGGRLAGGWVLWGSWVAMQLLSVALPHSWSTRMQGAQRGACQPGLFLSSSFPASKKGKGPVSASSPGGRERSSVALNLSVWKNTKPLSPRARLWMEKVRPWEVSQPLTEQGRFLDLLTLMKEKESKEKRVPGLARGWPAPPRLPQRPGSFLFLRDASELARPLRTLVRITTEVLSRRHPSGVKGLPPGALPHGPDRSWPCGWPCSLTGGGQWSAADHLESWFCWKPLAAMAVPPGATF